MSEIYANLDDDIQRRLSNREQVQLPNINLSKESITIVEGSIILGLNDIHDINKEIISKIIEEREHGSYLNFSDLLTRVPTLINAPSATNMLIKSGTLDDFGRQRRDMLEALDSSRFRHALDDYLNDKTQMAFEMEEGFPQKENTSMTPATELEALIERSVDVESSEDLVAMEMESLIRRPCELRLQPYKKAMALQGALSDLSQLRQIEAQRPTIAVGVIRSIREEEYTANKRVKMLKASLLIEDSSETATAILAMRKREYEKLHLAEEMLVLVKGKAAEKQLTIHASTVSELPPAREMISTLTITVPADTITLPKILKLKSVLASCPGIDSVKLVTNYDGKTLTAILPIRVDANHIGLKSYIRELFNHAEFSKTWEEE